MMSQMKHNWAVKLAAFFVLIWTFVASAEAKISCYTCNSAGQQGCEDAGRITNFYQDCILPGQDRCLKVVGPGRNVLRTCAGVGAPATEGCGINGDIQTCVCYSNYCNSSTKTDLAIGAVTYFAVIMIILLANYSL